MRYAAARTTMNTYGSALPETMKRARGGVAKMMLRSAKTGAVVQLDRNWTASLSNLLKVWRREGDSDSNAALKTNYAMT